jgi:glycosyltransferase involved in cell wall biosynthesis
MEFGEMNYPRPEIVSAKKIDPSSPQMALPRVSVIVTCFNYARYVSQALDSVASQIYENFDCVVIDDASTDHSGLMVERWIDERKDPRFHLIHNASNSGQTASFAAGLAATSGEFVAFLDADDFWFPEFLQRHVEAHLNRSFPVSISCSDLVQVTDEGRVLSGTVRGGPIVKEIDARRVSIIDADQSARVDGTGALQFRETLNVSYIAPGYRDNRTVTSGMMLRRSALDLIMPDEPSELRICTDGYVFVICHYFTGSLAIGSALGAYRRHGSNSFVSSPVMGTNLPCAPPTMKEYDQKIVRVMLRHLLDHHDRFATAFSDEYVRNLLRILFRKCLQYDVSIQDVRLRSVIGARRMLEDRVYVKLSFLRRLVSRLRM